MHTLYHFWLSPFSRKIRVQLAEKGVECDFRVERFWERRRDFLLLNPAGEVPVLVDADGAVVCDSQAIAEYLEERHPEPPLLGTDAVQRAETRRLVAWFDQKFNREVTRYLLREKLVKRLARLGGPASDVLRAGKENLRHHLDYIGYLALHRNYLAGDAFSLADIAAAAHLSCLDYMGDVPWDQHEDARIWYARVKSRPSFRPLLADQIAGLAPSAHYADLDF